MSDHTVFHHANMLNDHIRLNRFNEAMSYVINPKSVIVDIGAGTGILSAIANKFKPKEIYSIEYFLETANLMRKMLRDNQIYSITPIVDSSFNVNLVNKRPDILISETIGLIGPEENIVEIFYDFCKRHPSIKRCMPYELSIIGQFLYSKFWECEASNIKRKYSQASLDNYDYKYIYDDIEEMLSSNILQNDLRNSIAFGDPIPLVKYDLGKTPISDFNKVIFINDSIRENSNIFHLFFEAKLGNGLVINSSFCKDQLHWGHSFIPLNRRMNILRISYVKGQGEVVINWGQGR